MVVVVTLTSHPILSHLHIEKGGEGGGGEAGQGHGAGRDGGRGGGDAGLHRQGSAPQEIALDLLRQARQSLGSKGKCLAALLLLLLLRASFDSSIRSRIDPIPTPQSIHPQPNLLKFSGLVYEGDEEQGRAKVEDKALSMTSADLKAACDLLGAWCGLRDWRVWLADGWCMCACLCVYATIRSSPIHPPSSHCLISTPTSSLPLFASSKTNKQTQA